MKSLYEELTAASGQLLFLRNLSKHPDITYKCLKKKTTLNRRCRHSLYKRKFDALWDTKIIYDPFYPAAHPVLPAFLLECTINPYTLRPPVFRRVSSHFSQALNPHTNPIRLSDRCCCSATN